MEEIKEMKSLEMENEDLKETVKEQKKQLRKVLDDQVVSKPHKDSISISFSYETMFKKFRQILL